MLVPARGGERARLASWPRPYPQNPYLVRLADALAGQRVATVSHRYLAALVAAPRGARWLHVHWPEWMLRDSDRARARARAAWLFALLDAARARGVRLAWTAHNLLGHDEPHEDLARASRRALLERCSAVFGHFASAEADVRALGFTGRFALTPHPHYAADYPPALDRAEALRALGYDRDARVLLAFGAVEPYKGLDRLAAAFVESAPSDTVLHVAGSPTSSDAVRALRAAARGHPRVRLELGFVPPARVAQLFSAATALVLGYRAFYTSGTAMLALTYGTPVVGPPLHHLAALRGEPFFVPLATPDALPEALASLAALPPDARARARAFALEQRWESVARTVAGALFDAPDCQVRP